MAVGINELHGLEVKFKTKEYIGVFKGVINRVEYVLRITSYFLARLFESVYLKIMHLPAGFLFCA